MNSKFVKLSEFAKMGVIPCKKSKLYELAHDNVFTTYRPPGREIYVIPEEVVDEFRELYKYGPKNGIKAIRQNEKEVGGRLDGSDWKETKIFRLEAKCD